MKGFLHLLSIFLLLSQDVDAKASKAAAKAAIKTERDLSSAEMAAAGAFATAFGVTIMHPVDTIKTLQQSSEGIGLGMVQATNKIMKVIYSNSIEFCKCISFFFLFSLSCIFFSLGRMVELELFIMVLGHMSLLMDVQEH